jgi:hypothetical protein
MLIELLTRTNANPNLPDYSGQTFIEMVEKNIPDYLDHFTSCNFLIYNWYFSIGKSLSRKTEKS